MSASSPAIAKIPAIELEQLANDGGPRGNWFRELGASHRRRDESERREAGALGERDAQRQMAMRRRWPAVAAAIRAFVRGYNEGAGSEVIDVIDYTNSESGDLVLEIVARDGQTLTMALGGAELCVRPNRGTAGSPDGGARWLAFGITDEDTAAYALQHWMTQL